MKFESTDIFLSLIISSRFVTKKIKFGIVITEKQFFKAVRYRYTANIQKVRFLIIHL